MSEPAAPRGAPGRPWAGPALLVLLAVPLILWRLGSYGLVNGDEGLYHAVARRMLASGNWLRLEFAGHHLIYDTFMNAPLQYWLRAALIAAIGDSYWSMRLLSALAGIAAVLATVRLGQRLAPPEHAALAGFLAGLAQLTTFQFVYLHSARTGELDAAVAGVFAAIALLFLRALERGQSFAGHHLALASLFVIKLPLAIVPIAAEVAFLLLRREARGRLGGWLRTAAWVFPLGLVWHAANAVAYWEECRAVIAEMASQAAGGGGLGFAARALRNARFYAETAVFGAWPWVFAWPAALALAPWRRGAPELRRPAALFAAFAAAVWAFYALVDQHYPWYATPSYPFLSAFTGAWLARLIRGPARALDFGAAAVCLALAAWVALPLTGFNPFAATAVRTPMPWSWRQAPPLGPAAGVAVTAAGLWGAWALARRVARTRWRPWAGAAVALALAVPAVSRTAAPLRFTTHRGEMERAWREALARRRAGLPLEAPIEIREPGEYKVRFYFHDEFLIERGDPSRGVSFVIRDRPAEAADPRAGSPAP
jgi:4-amino-4-deoxy-L-arabinose transferase-like glycosyltransferase